MKLVMFIYSSLELHGGNSRVFRALRGARELSEAGHTVKIIFDGAGTESLAMVSNPIHDLHDTLEKVRPLVDGACKYCARSYGVAEVVEAAGYSLLSDYRGEASLAKYVDDGYQIITY